MKQYKKALALLLSAVLLLSALAGCAGEVQPTQSGTEPTQPSNSGNTGNSYTVQVLNRGGRPMAGVDVYIYMDDTLSDLKDYGQTDANGNASFQLPQGASYAIELRNLPAGYVVEKSYSFTGNTANILVNSQVITGGNFADARLDLGDVMWDFTVTTAKGEELTVSEILKEKEMVMLNFWYTTCQYCVEEFPYMQQAYEKYSEKVEIIALNPLDKEEDIKGFQESMQLTFPMASCPSSWAQVFGITGYPVSVMIDRYGMICLVEIGGMPSLRLFTSAFEHFTAADYKQVLCENGIGTLVSQIKPNVSMDTSENIGAAVNSGEIQVTYRPETEGDDAEYSWPFVVTEKAGATCLKASNQQIEPSYAILYADIYLEAGQAIGFDYWASTEAVTDILHVIVNDKPIYQISGDTQQDWEACYPWVAQEAGYYELALCYIKDDTTSTGEDTVYIKNMRAVDAADIDVDTYIPRDAATTKDEGLNYSYVDIVFNEQDGYYHVGSANGPLLLADLQGYTQFNSDKPLFYMIYDGDILVNGESYYETMLPYFSLASNSELSGVCTVNEELAQMLKKVAAIGGFDGTDEEWLKLCKYYEVYGAGDTQLADPIRGLSTFSALKATEGKGVETNVFVYNRVLMPRGLLAEFIPSRSGVYRITSTNMRMDGKPSPEGVEGWIVNENREIIYTYEPRERLNGDGENVSMLLYMEAGTPYYIDIAFWDIYENGYIYYDIEFEAEKMNVLYLASPAYFTFDTDATGEDIYYTIAGGIDVVLGEDGYYYHDLGDGKKGSMLYADFTGSSGLFDQPVVPVGELMGMIELGGFDFSKSELDEDILRYLKKFDNDVAATDEYLRGYWGANYDRYAEDYQLEEVYAGIYHGQVYSKVDVGTKDERWEAVPGQDMTEQIRAYVDKMITSGDEALIGCVPVDEELAQLLQMLVGKYSFPKVEMSWTKMCYYYQYLGPRD